MAGGEVLRVGLVLPAMAPAVARLQQRPPCPVPVPDVMTEQTRTAPKRLPIAPGLERAARLEREAAALRENLRRRKHQARAREDGQAGPPSPPATSSEPG